MSDMYNTDGEYNDPRNYSLKGVLLEMVIVVIFISFLVYILS